MATHPPQSINSHDISAWILAAIALIFTVKFGLLPALISGLLVFEVVHLITPMIAKRFSSKRKDNYSKLWAVGIIVFIIVSLLALAVAGLVAFLRSDAGSLTVLLAKMAQILEDSRKMLPEWLLTHLPSDAIAFKELLTAWLRTHADQLQTVGKEAGRVTAHVIIGMIIGGMLALREAVVIEHYKPFSRALVTRVSLFGDAFRRIVFAQIRISTVNTIFTAIYLALVLPMLGIHLPLVKTMIAITFVVGLIPVIGNLISNTVIVVVSLSHSLGVAVGSLAYLVVIHKFEYFLNARIVGSQIQARAWELLIAMLCMEAAFGLVGIVAAPIYYAYIKAELRLRNLI
ncbi:MAG: hypothetical protein CVU29_06035 [Betaproteobacteria bacterium HGW-Betaproteobacteria-22]|nr:MAG: hypothetical protein CVU29_06035 [Betaproteobacteria bacterium HGW-Betaproteobacteria-22]